MSDQRWFCAFVDTEERANYKAILLRKRYPEKQFRVLPAKDSLTSFTSKGFVVEANSKEEPINLCKIFGVDKASNFRRLVSENLVEETCKHIWDHPEEYGKFADSYGDFLKYLWVEYPSGDEYRLADLVNYKTDEFV